MEDDTNATYDFIIVGSGPTGSVLANRLSEIPEWNILLLEAGEEASQITDLPILCGAFEFTSYNWGYKTEPQTGFCRGCSTDEEVSLLKDNFGSCIENKSYPSAQDLKEFIKKTAICRIVPVIKAKLQQLLKKSDM
ncbi:hypothetical protein JTB14_017397 [Gonioctena quinquepunctata]|nr:hypothetical protein JTB14_017397 [Gonioctena quinquepunctata]